MNIQTMFYNLWIYNIPYKYKFCIISKIIWKWPVAPVCNQRRTSHHEAEPQLPEIKNIVITAAFHWVGTKHRGLASPSENACSRKAASVIAPTSSGSRLSKLLFRKCCSFLCLLYHCYVTSLNLSSIACFKRSWELLLEVSTCLRDL